MVCVLRELERLVGNCNNYRLICVWTRQDVLQGASDASERVY